MNAQPQIAPALTRWLWLSGAAVCSLLTSPRWPVPLAAWLGPLCLLQFFRGSSGGRAAVCAWLAAFATGFWALDEVVPLPRGALAVFTAVGAAIGLIPYLVDRAWARRLPPGSVRTLIFPVCMVALDVISASGPQGVWASPANTQATIPLVIQSTALVGLWGVVFLMHWTASSLADLIEVWPVNRRLAVRVSFPCLAVLLATGLWGLSRLAPRDDQDTVRLGAVIPENIGLMLAAYEDVSGNHLELPPETSQSDPRLVEAGRGIQELLADPDPARFPRFHAARCAFEDRLFAASAEAVAGGARLVTWTEGASLRTKGDEHELLERGRAFAREQGVFLFLPYVALFAGEVPPDGKIMENKLAIIDSRGEILKLFLKNKPVGGVEPSVAGDGQIPVFDTDLGRIGVSICYDADFPAHMRQLGSQQADLLVLPSGDWRAIAPYHSYMAALRGVENGCAVFRPVSHGMSLATNACGQVVAQHDSFTVQHDVFLADLPRQRRTTLYPRVGDAFGWLCCAATLFLVVALRFSRRITA